MNRPVILVPGAALLARRLTVPIDVRRRLATGRASTATDGSVSAARQEVARLLTMHRAARLAAVPARAALMGRWHTRRAGLAERIAAAVHPGRTPERVLADLLTVARQRSPGPGTRAGVIVRSSLPAATATTLVRK